MVQNALLILMVILCALLIISIIKNPFDTSRKNICKFKILPPKYSVKKNQKTAEFSILVEKKHRYFINFPLLFKFYSKESFKTLVRIKYFTEDEEQILFEKNIEFTNTVCEYIVYITDIIMGKITVEIFLDIELGNPIVAFEILNNSTCDLTREYKLELKFPDK